MIVRRLNVGTYSNQLPFCVYLFPAPQQEPLPSPQFNRRTAQREPQLQAAYRLRDIDVLFCDKQPGYVYSCGKIPPVFTETPGHLFKEQNGDVYLSARAIGETATRLGNHFLAEFCRLDRSDFFSGSADRLLGSITKLTRVPIHESEYEFNSSSSPRSGALPKSTPTRGPSTSPKVNGLASRRSKEPSPLQRRADARSSPLASDSPSNGTKRTRMNVDEIVNKSSSSGLRSQVEPDEDEDEADEEDEEYVDETVVSMLTRRIPVKSEPTDDTPGDGPLYTPSTLSAILDDNPRDRKRRKVPMNVQPMPNVSLFTSSKSKDPAMMDQVRKSLELKQQQKAIIEARAAQQQSQNQQQSGRKNASQASILPRPGAAGGTASNASLNSPTTANNPQTSNLLRKRPVLSPGHKNARGLTIKTGHQMDATMGAKSAPIQASHSQGYAGHGQSGLGQQGYSGQSSGSSEGSSGSNPPSAQMYAPRTAIGYPAPSPHHPQGHPQQHLPHHMYASPYGNGSHSANASQTVNGLISPRASDFAGVQAQAQAQAQAHANAAYNQQMRTHLPPPPNTAAIIDRQHAAEAGRPHHGDNMGALPSPSYFAAQQAALQNMPANGPLTSSHAVQHHSSKASYLQVFDTFYDALSDSRVLKATLEEQLRKSSGLLQTLQASASMIENMVRREFREMQREMIKDLMVLERRIERLEDKVWMSPNNLPELRPDRKHCRQYARSNSFGRRTKFVQLGHEQNGSCSCSAAHDGTCYQWRWTYGCCFVRESVCSGEGHEWCCQCQC